MRNLYYGTVMSYRLGSKDPEIGEKSEDELTEELYQKRLSRFHQWAEGRKEDVLSTQRCFDYAQHDMQDTWIAVANGQLPNQVRHCVRPSADDGKITYTSFIPYITSVSKQCLQPMGTVARIMTLLLFVSLCFSLQAQAQSRQEVGAADGRTDATIGLEKVAIERNSIPYFVNIRDVSHKRQMVLHYSPKADLESYPLFEYKARPDLIDPIAVGEQIPDEIWDLPLRIVNDSYGRDSVTLRDLAGDKMLVLDFWATWCRPCMLSMDKWQDVLLRHSQDLQVVGLMMDYDHKADPTIAERGWTMPQLIGPEVYLLNYYFMGTPIVGPSSWAYQGRYWGITPTRNDNETLLRSILSGGIKAIPEENRWKGLRP